MTLSFIILDILQFPLIRKFIVEFIFDYSFFVLCLLKFMVINISQFKGRPHSYMLLYNK